MSSHVSPMPGELVEPVSATRSGCAMATSFTPCAVATDEITCHRTKPVTNKTPRIQTLQSARIDLRTANSDPHESSLTGRSDVVPPQVAISHGPFLCDSHKAVPERSERRGRAGHTRGWVGAVPP